MRKSALIGAALGVSLMVSPAAFAEEKGDVEATAETEMTKGEKRLAKLIEGRVAGEPQNCIRVFPNERLTVIDDTAYVYGRGNTIYVQKTSRPDRIDDRDVLVSRRFNATQLCRQDVVTTVDPVTGIFTGAVFFEEFVPYTRVEEDEQAG
ncbi:hypothetical protein [Erythrobacter sp. YT30]|uniref:hypothetical protein n=1 Tax=Erythrobacter sp. YT30 TaxID=1735012 RepID=UPI000AC5928E|nr:hypothetical protein [Erythrobacter sp. YT30]